MLSVAAISPVTSRRGSRVVVAAKGRNARRKGRNPSKPVAPIIPNQNGSNQPKEASTGSDDDEQQQRGRQRQRKSKREKRLPNVKYSERTGKPINMTGGQVSKASLKRIKEAREKTKDAEAEELKAKRKFQQAKSKAVPQIVTDRMLSRVVRFSGIPMVLGFTTGPFYYYFAKINVQEWLEPWMFFTASTATFGAAFVGITYGVLSASWDPSREGSALGLDEFKMNIPILFQTIMGKSDSEYTASEFDVDGEGDYD